MKDAFGGTFMLRVLIVFFVIYISIMTVAIGFSKAFRVKNNVINILERTEYRNDDVSKCKAGDTSNDICGAIDKYLSSVSYDYSKNDTLQKQCTATGGKYISRGICISNMVSNDKKYYKYYKVTSYFVISAPLFKINMTAPITGETKVINL